MSLILFDFDGVLADTLGDLLQFGQEVCDELGVQHIATQEDLNSLEVMSFATYGIQLEVPAHLVDEFVRRCLSRFAEKKSPPAIFDGLAEVVRKLAKENVLAVVTGNSTQNVNAFLEEHGILDCFRAVYGVDLPGSKVQKISLAREQFSAGMMRESVFMVGDSLSDIRAAKEAGIQSVAVAWGHQSLDRLLSGDPDHVVRSVQELLTLFAV